MATKVQLLAASDLIAGFLNSLPNEGYTDEFNRANEALEANANWTRVGGVAGGGQIVSNVLKSNTTDNAGTAYRCPDMGSASQYVSGVFQSNATSGFLCCRLTDPANYIGMRYNSSTLDIYKKITGNFALIRSVSVARGASVFKMEYNSIAGTIRVTKDAAEIIPETSVGALTGLPPSTFAGVVLRNATLPFVDSFAAGAL